MAIKNFQGMTSEELGDWTREVRPMLIRMQERSREAARKQALEMITRPVRREDRPTLTPQETANDSA